MTHVTTQEIEAIAKRRGLSRLTAEHLERWRVLAEAAQDTTWLRDAVAEKTVEPIYGAAIAPLMTKGP